MKKLQLAGGIVGVILITALGVGGYVSLHHSAQQHRHQQTSALTASRQILGARQTFWRQQGKVTAQASNKGHLQAFQYAQNATMGSTWIFHRGQLGGYTRINYQELKARLRKTDAEAGSTGTAYHFATIKQLNQALAKAKAHITIRHYSDLSYYRDGTVSVQNNGFIASGHHLYALSMAYGQSSAELGGVEMAQVFTDKGFTAPRHHLGNRQIAGNWVDNEYDALQVRDGQLYVTGGSGNFTSVSRTNVEDLAKQSATSLYASRYPTQVATAMYAGYTIPQATARVAGDQEYMYLFLSSTKMVRLKDGHATVFHKSTAKSVADDAHVDAHVRRVFAAADRQRQARTRMLSPRWMTVPTKWCLCTP